MRQDQPTAERKQRGAFFTPRSIAGYLARWAVADDPSARVLDPTCGESVFLVEAGRRLSALTAANEAVRGKLYGVELHRESLEASRRRLEAAGVGARLLAEDFFLLPTPDQLGGPLPFMDAVIGNPPYVRYQEHSGENRRRSAAAALRQGVRLTGLASSWASVLVHACAFLKPTGRLAMVLPAELLTVGYAEPVRQWLRERFAQVHLVFFDTLQFEGALEKVVLLVARGSGGCDAFSLWVCRACRRVGQSGAVRQLLGDPGHARQVDGPAVAYVAATTLQARRCGRLHPVVRVWLSGARHGDRGEPLLLANRVTASGVRSERRPAPSRGASRHQASEGHLVHPEAVGIAQGQRRAGLVALSRSRG